MERDQDEIEHQSLRKVRTVRQKRASFIEKQSKKGRGDHTADPREAGYRRPPQSGRQK